MAKLPTAEPDEDAGQKKKQAERLATEIGVSVMRALGQPDDFYRVSVMRLWGNHYRVNVQTGADAVSTRIAHSFFLSVGDDGNVIASDPAITRLY